MENSASSTGKKRLTPKRRLLKPVGVVACLLCPAGLEVLAQTTEPPAQSTPFKFESKVHEVLVPVLVLDAVGRSVGTLREKDFQVFDKGKRQILSNFAIERSENTESPGLAGSVSTKERAPVRKSPSSEESRANWRYIALLFDDIHIDRGDLIRLRGATSRILSHSLSDNDVAAILSTSGRVNTGFTRDQARLQQAIASLRDGTTLGRPRSDCPDIDHYEAYQIIYMHDPQALEVVAQGGEHCPPPSPDKHMNEGVARAAAESELPIEENRTAATFNVIREVARQMGNLAGERTLILISPGFIALTPEAELAKSRVLDIAAVGNVRVGTLDARGLFTEMEDESKILPSQELDQFVQHSRIAYGSVLDQLARGTGGMYFHNSNDFEGGLRTLISEPEFRYLLEFAPNTRQDGVFHPIKVKVNQKGVRIYSRHGYFAEVLRKRAK